MARHARFLPLLGLALSMGVLASACGTTAPDPAPPAERAASGAASAGQSDAARPLPDAHALTGLSVVQPIGDPQPLANLPAQELPVTVTDVEGNTVTVTDTSRILALDLYGTLSRTLLALGLGESIVGRSVSSTEDALADLPVVTESGHSLNTEAVLALAPTLVLADRSIGPVEAIDQLRAAGIPVVLVDPTRSLEGTPELLREVAAAVGMPEAGEALVARTTSAIEEARSRIATWTPSQPLDAAFLYVRGTAGVFFVLGPDEGAGALIEAVGARDVAGEKGLKGVTPATAEALVALDPEVILVMEDGLASTDGIDGLLARPGVAQTRAGRNRRVVAIPDGMALSFGPQTAEVMLAVSRALHGIEDGE